MKNLEAFFVSPRTGGQRPECSERIANIKLLLFVKHLAVINMQRDSWALPAVKKASPKW